MIIGDHVIVCFHRALNNQVYAAGVSVATVFYVSWANSTLALSLWRGWLSWWSVLVVMRLSHVLILVSYYHCVTSTV